MNDKPHISVVSPVYGAADLLNELVRRIKESVSKITDNYEIILVEDCGPDDSWEKIATICNSDQRIKGIQHSRNFGQQYALNCGLDHSKGEWVVTLDCDLQDRPEEIINLYNKTLEGYDIVLARRENRQDDFLKRFFSNIFYKTFGYLTDTDQDASIANFAIYNRKVVDALKSMKDYIRYYPAMIQWVGFRLTKIDVCHDSRVDGKKSSYSFIKRFRLAGDTILSFSNKPLKLAVRLGVAISMIASLFAIALILRYFMIGENVTGWTSLFLSLWFLSGLIISVLGMVGLYIGKTFEVVKGRPTYIVRESINIDQQIF